MLKQQNPVVRIERQRKRIIEDRIVVNSEVVGKVSFNRNWMIAFFEPDTLAREILSQVRCIAQIASAILDPHKFLYFPVLANEGDRKSFF